ncbi:hypothetical protein Tco_0720171 [Tanacetum coccineum]
MLQARENLMEAIQAFLTKYDQVPPKEKSMDLLLAEERFLKIKQVVEEEQNQPENIQELLLKLINDLQILNRIQLKQEEQAAKESIILLNEIDSQIPLSITIIPVLPTLEPEDSLIMGNEELSTIPEKESNKFIKSSVEDLVPIPSESKDTSESDSDCDLPSGKESLPDEDVPKDNVKIYSNPLFEFNDEYISSDVNPLFDEVLENIESKDYYVSNLDEPTLLVTPLSDFNEDECFNPGGDVDEIKFLLYRDPSTPKISIVSILEGFTDEPPLEENANLFDLESKTNEWKKILYDAPINDLMTKDKNFDPGGDIDEIDAFLDIDISTDIKDGYHDSEGDLIYLESLLFDDTIPNLPPKVFLDHDPRSLSDINDLKIMVKVFDPGIHEENFSPTYMSLSFEDIFPSHILNHFVEIPSGESKVHIEVLSVLWGNRLLIPDGSLPLSRYRMTKTMAKRTKPSTGLKRVQEIEAEGIYIFK